MIAPGFNHEPLQDLKKLSKELNIKIFKVSGATAEGLEEVMNYVGKELKTLPKEGIIEGEERVVYTLEEDKKEFEITIENGEYNVRGVAVEKLMGRVNMEDNESLHYFQKMLKNLGIDDELKRLGIKEGDIVKFIDYEMEWYEG